MFWVDETIEEILKQRDKKYLITDYKTPSGKIHVGALRGVVIHDAIFRGLTDKNLPAEYWYGFDDFDPIDALSPELKEEYSKYMGVPLCNVPSPKSGYKNFAHYFADDFIKVFHSMGVKAKIIWASELYKQGIYNKAIKIVLDNAEKIRQIYKEVSGGEKPKDWYPLQVVCPKCGKIGTTKVTDWDGEEVVFTCEENLVGWAKGCGCKGKISPFDGNGKMLYKVETAAKWFTFGTSVELAGKDHYTKGGTFFIARQIAEDVFRINPAFGYGYEWFLIGGKKMSTSKGVGSSAEEIASILPPQILRFLMIRTRAKRTIDFDIEGETIPLLYDEFDRVAAAFQKDPETDLAKAYYYAKLNSHQMPPEYVLRFSKVAHLANGGFKLSPEQYAAEEKGSELSIVEAEELQNRIEIAKKWLESYAPESYRFSIASDFVPEQAKKMSAEQKEFLRKIADIIKTKEKWTGEELHPEIHEIRKAMSIDPREAFLAIYLSFIGKDSGPQAGWLLASLERNFVIKRLEEVTNA